MQDETLRPIDLDLWERVTAGGGTAEDLSRVRAWIRSVAGDPPDNARLREAVRALERASGVPAIDAAAFTRAVMARARRASARGPQRAPWAARAAVAAAVLITIAAGFGIIAHDWPFGVAANRRYVTAPGERLNVTLADGTTFSLAPASRVDVPRDYASGHRVVQLDGEALFEVAHDARHPFAVRTTSGMLTDVGTRFDVRAYAGDRQMSVAVAEGAVAMSIDRAGAPPATGTLAAGDVVSVTPAGVAAIRHVGDVGAYIAWQSGRLVFRDATMDDVARTLSRWYATDVVADAAIASRTLTGAYTNLPLDEVLNLVSHASGTVVVRRGATISFR